MITLQYFKTNCPSNKSPEVWVDALNLILPKYDITTKLRISMFIAQCGHESLDFTAGRENLNYSAAGLLKVFRKYFNETTANQCARQPERIANIVYANRLGNNQVGDGWKFRGGGAIQLTGRANYAAFGATIGKTAEQAVEYIATPAGSIESACYYWKLCDLNKFADKSDIVGATRTINGGTNGLDDRKARFIRALHE